MDHVYPEDSQKLKDLGAKYRRTPNNRGWFLRGRYIGQDCFKALYWLAKHGELKIDQYRPYQGQDTAV